MDIQLKDYDPEFAKKVKGITPQYLRKKKFLGPASEGTRLEKNAMNDSVYRMIERILRGTLL